MRTQFLVVLIMVAAVAAPPALAQPADLLGQYVAEVKAKPQDYALREQVIRYVQGINRPPETPDAAERFTARGVAAMRLGNYADAVTELEQATLAAPWLGDAYYNLGLAQDQVGRYKDAIRNLNLYLFANPAAPDAKKVKTLVYEIEYRQEQAEKRQEPAAKPKGLPALAGNWYRKDAPPDEPYANYAHYRAEMRGNELFIIYVIDVPYWDWRKGQERVFYIVERLDGTRLVGRVPDGMEPGTSVEFSASQDFMSWEFTYRNGYTTNRQVYERR